MSIKFSAIAFVLVSLLALEAFAAPLRVCLDPDTGRIRARKTCGGFFTRELTNENTVHGQLVTVTGDENATLITASAHILGPMVRVGVGVYEINTTISDLTLCTITVSQALGSGGSYLPRATLVAFPNPIDATKISIEATNSAGVLADMGYNVIAHCPSGI